MPGAGRRAPGPVITSYSIHYTKLYDYHGELAAVSEVSGVVLWRREISSYAGLDADWRQLYITDEARNNFV